MGVRLPQWSAVLVTVILSALVTAPLAHAKLQTTEGTVRQNIVQKDAVQKDAVQKNTAQRSAVQKAALQQNVPQKNTPKQNALKRRTVRLCAASEKAAVRPIWAGSQGWLFGRPDLITGLALPEAVPGYLGRIATALKTEGVTPVALVVPTRGTVAYRHMNLNPALASYDPGAAARGYESFLEQLRAAGFIAPDLLEVARSEGEGFFFKRDHHWTPRAARAVAQAVAAQLRAQLSAQLGPLSKTSFVTRPRPPRTQLGTLQRQAQARCPASWPRERVAQFETRPVRTQKPVSEALFADQTPRVVLAGTSNSHRGEGKPELDFDGFLQAALGLEVLNVSFPGSGVYGSLDAYLRSHDFRQNPPVVLLWETLYMSWQKRSSLADELRQLLPSIYGACSNPLARRKLEDLPKGWTKLLDAPDASAGGFYAHLVLDDPTLTRFEFRLRYPDHTEPIRVARTTRVPNSGEFFLDLGGYLEGQPDEELEVISLDLPKAASGGARLSICPFPAAAFWPR